MSEQKRAKRPVKTEYSTVRYPDVLTGEASKGETLYHTIRLASPIEKMDEDPETGELTAIQPPAPIPSGSNMRRFTTRLNSSNQEGIQWSSGGITYAMLEGNALPHTWTCSNIENFYEFFHATPKDIVWLDEEEQL